MSWRRRASDAIGPRIVARSAALADRIERARGAPSARERVTTAELEQVRASVDRLEARLQDVQALTARAYEAAFDWPARLAAARAAPGYERAWSDDRPLVTVRIATYDNAATLCERTLPSVQAQTYDRWEAVVVGDAVTDDTEARIAALGDDRIRFLDLPFRGPYPEDARARWLIAGTAPANRALSEARGAWIAPLDHDDAFEPDHLAVLLEHARSTHAEVAYGQLRLLDASDGLLLGSIGAWPPRIGGFAWQGAIYHAALTCFRYDEHARFADEPGDWNLARRMWEAGVRFAFLERHVGAYHHAPVDAEAAARLAHLRASVLSAQRHA